MTGLTGRVRVVRFDEHGDRDVRAARIDLDRAHRVAELVDRDEDRRPRDVDAAGLDDDVARAAVTVSTIDFGPSTATCRGSTVVSPISLPDGTAPCSTTTGTVRLWRVEGHADHARLERDHLDPRIDRRDPHRNGTGPAFGSTPLRSTDAAKLDAVGVGTSAAAK